MYYYRQYTRLGLLLELLPGVLAATYDHSNLHHLRHGLIQVSDKAEISHLENRRLSVLQ